MPKLDRQLFEDLSEKTDFQMDVLEKVYRLSEFLREIARTELRDKLVLKGGTAINFVYFDFPRLSVDIDVDYIGSTNKEKMLKDREASEEILSRLFQTLGYDPEGNESYALQQYNLFYENSAGNRDRIQLEINFLKRVPILDPVKRMYDHFFNFDSFKILTLKIEELFGQKFKALIKRATARDLYDIYKLLTSELDFDENLMKKCFIFSLCLDGDPRKVNFKVLDQITHRDVRRTLLPYLRKGEEINLQEMKNGVQQLIKRFLSFTGKEKKFIEQLFEGRNCNPKILFAGMEFSKDLKDHPGIEWRLRNI